MMQHPPDSEILRLLQSGDTAQQEAAFRHLYRQYFGLIESLVTTNNGDQESARDVFQDGIIVLFNNVKKEGFVLSSSLKTYLYSICRNLWLMKLRSARRETPLEDHHQHIQLNEDIFKTIVHTERQQMVAKLLEKIGEDCRRIIELFYFRRARMAQIMEAFNLGSEQAAKNKKSLCLKKLRDLALASEELKTMSYE